MQRLVTAGLLPERAGQPVKAWVHISLADLLALDGSSALQGEWAAGVRAQWAAHRAEASAGGSDGGAWLDGDAATAMTCDAAMAPIVTGEVNPAALDDLVRLCVNLDRLRHHSGGDDTSAPAPDTSRAWEALEQAIIGKAVDLLSGPGGLASFLRRRPAPGSAARVSRWTSAIPRPSQRASATPSSCATSTASGPGAQPARLGVPGAPRQAQGQRRQDQRSRLCSTMLVPPPSRDPPVGLDAGPEPRRYHYRMEPR